MMHEIRVHEVPLSHELRFVGARPLTVTVSVFIFQSGSNLNVVLHGAVTEETEKKLYVNVYDKMMSLAAVHATIDRWLEDRLKVG